MRHNAQAAYPRCATIKTGELGKVSLGLVLFIPIRAY